TGQTILAGNLAYIFEVKVNGDVSVESDESFIVNVTNVSGATVANGQGQATIQNDDIPPASLSIDDVNSIEGNSGTNKLTFTVSSSLPAPSGGISFNIGTADGSA